MGEPVEVIIGTVGRAHGLRGEVSVHSRTDFPADRYAPGVRVRTSRGQVLTVADARPHQGGLLVRFLEITDRATAEDLRGSDLWAAGMPAEATTAEEYHDVELIGLAVVDAAGGVLGSVAEVLHLPAQDVLVVRTPTGDRLVPFVQALVPEIDLAAGRLEVVAIPGLFDDAAEVARAD